MSESPPSWLAKDRATVFVIPKVKKNFADALAALVEEETGQKVDPIRLDDDLTEWAVTRVVGKARAKGQKKPSTKALWRAFRALAAARYHFREKPERQREVLELRDRIEALWLEERA